MKQTIRWGILGTGYIARKFAEGLSDTENAELYAVASRTEETASAFAREFDIPVFHGSYEALACNENIDAVYVATPHNLHFSNTLMCLKNNKHVLCEKPFAVNVHEVKQMVEEATKRKLFLMEAMWSRFLPNIIKTKELIDNGAIGEVQFLKCDFGINPGYNEQNRLFNRQLIGGSLLDVGIYPVFLSLFLLGKPLEINALAQIGPTMVDHSCGITFRYPNALASLCSSAIAKTETIAEIHGTKGKIIIDPMWFCPVNIHLFDDNDNEIPVNLSFKGNGYNYEAQEVTNCLLNGLTESTKMSHAFSIQLIEILDLIRKQCNIQYPDHD
jgi:scyllo-inositol 2-dehydrogenase (NADP+)